MTSQIQIGRGEACLARWILTFLMIVCAAFALSLEETAKINLPENAEPIALASDGMGRYFILNSSGRIAALDTGGNIVAELDPMASDVDFVEPVGIAFSAGWLYIADRTGEALHITDRNLREPATVELEFDNQSVRPGKIAVATDGKILLWDENRGELLLFDDWSDKSPVRLILPDSKRRWQGIDAMRFDRINKDFFVIRFQQVVCYSLLGEMRYVRKLNIAPSDSGVTDSARQIAFFSADSGYIYVDTERLYILNEYFSGLESHKSSGLIDAIRALDGRIVTLHADRLRIWELRRF